MPAPGPSRQQKAARLAAALNELGHAPLAIYPDAERAVLVVSRPNQDLSLPVVVPEAGVPGPADGHK
jgi:hypothetical protein